MPPFLKPLPHSLSKPPTVEGGLAPGMDAAAESGDAALLLAERIRATGLATPATLLLRVLRPAHWLGGQALYIAQPLLESLGVGAKGKGGRPSSLSPALLARFFENETSVDSLIHNLESPPDESNDTPPTQHHPPAASSQQPPTTKGPYDGAR